MLEVDTDKVNAEVPAPVSGILREILAKEGETVQAGAEIAVVETGDGAVTATPEAPDVPSPPRGEGQSEGREQKQPKPTAQVETVEREEHRYTQRVQMTHSDL